MKTNTKTLRENWLSNLAAAMAPVIEDRAGITLPPYRVTCGFPSSGGMIGKKSRTRGQCWSASSSDDGHAEIFISPVENDTNDIAAILAHEMIHAALPEAGHKRPFQIAAGKIGHVKPFTSSSPTPEFLAWAVPMIMKAGAYPHAKLNAIHSVGAKKKQGTRLLKAECLEDFDGGEKCGYTVRVTNKWLEGVGAPHCPLHGAMFVEGYGEPEEEDDE